jgi:hypothetical protein
MDDGVKEERKGGALKVGWISKVQRSSFINHSFVPF